MLLWSFPKENSMLSKKKKKKSKAEKIPFVFLWLMKVKWESKHYVVDRAEWQKPSMTNAPFDKSSLCTVHQLRFNSEILKYVIKKRIY